jgi:hypothetical protein
MGKTRGESTCRDRRRRHEGSINNVRFTQTLELGRAMSALCQKQTHAPQQFFGHAVGGWDAVGCRDDVGRRAV